MYWNLISGTALLNWLYVEPQHKMYWNMSSNSTKILASDVEPQHKMYWNWRQMRCLIYRLWVEPQHKMYWNASCPFTSINGAKLNRNIRCIEIFLRITVDAVCPVEPQHKMYWNTLLRHTLAPFTVEPQHKMYWNWRQMRCLIYRLWLNRNIRCIEIQIGTKISPYIRLNRNIRCIEIIMFLWIFIVLYSWTAT